jgi:hypothetical protein
MATEQPFFRAGPESIVSVLGVTYVHRRTTDGGDMYLTGFGMPFADLLDVDNWYERSWFETHRERLEGTSAVYRVMTKEVGGRRLNLVVKNSRVGEDVPLDTRTLLEFINTEFNSPWEEFALVMELRDGQHGPPDLRIFTQEPLAIYVPPQKMQGWQSGRSVDRINRIRARHPGVDIDILRQYKLIYRWIEGKNVIEALTECAHLAAEDLPQHLGPITLRAIGDLSRKGYAVADMKPEHVIIGEKDVAAIDALGRDSHSRPRKRQVAAVRSLVRQGRYSVIDYELLVRTAEHEQAVKARRRHTYLDDQRARFNPAELPEHLSHTEVFGVPYVYGHVESTDGTLWVVGRNGRLFDYFLPERWRTAQSVRLSDNNEVDYMLTKDNVHLVRKTSRVGEIPTTFFGDERDALARERGYNSPFEAFAVAHHLAQCEVPTVYVRAIYRTGSAKIEEPADPRRYENHKGFVGPDDVPILTPEHDYITIRGYFNGTDAAMAEHDRALLRPIDLRRALRDGLVDSSEARRIMQRVVARLREVGYDGALLAENDLLLAVDPAQGLVCEASGHIEARICSLELVYRR